MCVERNTTQEGGLVEKQKSKEHKPPMELPNAGQGQVNTKEVI